jgi:diamine N-acetyltransferase
MIRGDQIELRPATLEDRRMIFEWGHDSDIAPFIYPSSGATSTFGDFCVDWKEHFFTDESPELGRMFIIQYEDSPVGTIAYNDIDSKNRVELDIWMNCEANCGRGFGSDAIRTLCGHLSARFGVDTFMMQPSARNPRAIRAYEKAGFVRTPATAEQIRMEWGGVDSEDSVLMIRKGDHTAAKSTLSAVKPRRVRLEPKADSKRCVPHNESFRMGHS